MRPHCLARCAKLSSIPHVPCCLSHDPTAIKCTERHALPLSWLPSFPCGRQVCDPAAVVGPACYSAIAQKVSLVRKHWCMDSAGCCVYLCWHAHRRCCRARAQQCTPHLSRHGLRAPLCCKSMQCSHRHCCRCTLPCVSLAATSFPLRVACCKQACHRQQFAQSTASPSVERSLFAKIRSVIYSCRAIAPSHANCMRCHARKRQLPQQSPKRCRHFCSISAMYRSADQARLARI